MNLFLKEKLFKTCAVYKMTEHFNFDKELFFENTPLQNLKNILSDADASMELEAIETPNNKFGQATLFERKGVSKSALQEAINDLVAAQGQYISSAVIGRVVCKLCFDDNHKNKQLIEQFNNNTNINRLKYLLKLK